MAFNRATGFRRPCRGLVAICLLVSALSGPVAAAQAHFSDSVMDWQEARRAAVPFYSQYPLFYFLLTPGPLVFTVFLILRMKRKGRSSLVLVLFLLTASNLPSAPGADSSLRATSALETLVRQGQQAFESGRYGQALEKFGKAYDGMPSNAVLSHNLALCHYKLNNRGISAHLLRRSIGENPSLPEPRQALFQLEKELGLSAQVPAHSRIHPNIPFTIMIIFFNISIVFLGAVIGSEEGACSFPSSWRCCCR